MLKQTYFLHAGRKKSSRIKQTFSVVFGAVLAASAFFLPGAFAVTDPYTWQQLPASTNGIVSQSSGMSADGNTLYVTMADEDKIFYSSDKGANWSLRTYPATSAIFELAVSAAGTKLVAVNNSNAFISNDSAQTWSGAIAIGCNVKALDMSADGNTLVAGCLNGYIYTSTNGGLNWTQRTGAGSQRWQDVAIAADGSKMVAAYSYTQTSTTGSIYTSVDNGATWTQQAGAGVRYWQSVDISGDGSRLVATAPQLTPSQSPSDIYRSLDGGATWTTQAGLGQVIDAGTGVVISDDGQTVVASDRQNDNPVVKVSTDAGASWVHTDEFDFFYNMTQASLSSDGTTILLPNNQGPVVLSDDEGSTWNIQSDVRAIVEIGWTNVATALDGAKAWLANWYPSGALQYTPDGGSSWQDIDSIGSHDLDGVAASSDGQYVTAVGGCSWGQTYIHVSSDGGQTWTVKMNDQKRSWDEVAMSADGKVQIATVCGEYIYVSTDYGQTWTVKMNDQTRNWTDVVVSADGTRLLAFTTTSGAYYSSDSGQTWTLSASTATKRFSHAAMTADGKTIIAGTNVAGGDFVYRSDDYGVTWQSITSLGAKRWQGAAVSADGSRMAVSTQSSVTGPGVYISSDGGVSWELQTGVSDYTELTMSADGTVVYSTTWGDVRKGVTITPPVAPPAPAGGIVAGASTVAGTGTPGSVMIMTLPGGSQVTALVSVLGAFTVQLPPGVTLQAGDSITLQQRSAAGILGASTTVTVLAASSGGSLANTGMNMWAVLMASCGLLAASLVVRRCMPRRL